MLDETLLVSDHFKEKITELKNWNCGFLPYRQGSLFRLLIRIRTFINLQISQCNLLVLHKERKLSLKCLNLFDELREPLFTFKPLLKLLIAALERISSEKADFRFLKQNFKVLLQLLTFAFATSLKAARGLPLSSLPNHGLRHTFFFSFHELTCLSLRRLLGRGYLLELCNRLESHHLALIVVVFKLCFFR